MTNKSDEQLISQFLRGDRDALGELVEKYQRPLYFFCLRMVSDHEDALEVVQKTFVQVLEKLNSLQKRNVFKIWLYKIALNLCRNLLRDRTVYRKTLASLPHMEAYHTPEPAYGDDDLASLEKEEAHAIIQDSLDQLAEHQRSAVILRIYHKLSYLEISEILGCQECTARSHFHLGMKKLSGQLKKCFQELRTT